MRVLVACEESQEVCKAFRALGHEGWQSVGRVLPNRFLYFEGDGCTNHFSTEYGGGEYWKG